MSLHVHPDATVKCSCEGKVMQKGTELVAFIVSLNLQLELERTGAPLACVTVEHGALCEGHVTFCVNQDNSIGPKWEGTERIQA